MTQKSAKLVDFNQFIQESTLGSLPFLYLRMVQGLTTVAHQDANSESIKI
jgi:hypothetical protein